MLHVVMQNTDPTSQEEEIAIPWHVGEELKLTPIDIRYVLEVQADGDELQAVYEKFDNIPTSAWNRVVRWYGDHAKFIAANL